MSMDIDAIRQAVEHASLFALGVAFLTGIVFSFNPVALASIPVALAYVTKARTPRQSILFGSAFTSGMFLVQALLGFIAGLSGDWVASLAGRQWGLLLGPVLIVLGFIWAGWIRLPIRLSAFKAWRPNTMFGAFALGAVFAVAVCPVCNPELVVLIGAAAASASPLFGAVLLLAFAVGRAIPIVLGASAVGWLENLRAFSKFQKPIEIAGGLTLIVFGLYMLNAYYFWIPQLAT
jgi:cytochrome c-type biogenesis protein